MDKFSELIAKGVAQFNHTPVAPETPATDPIVRSYNTIFGMATDTHMSLVDGQYIITGSVFKKKAAAERIFSARGSGAVDFRPSGYWSAFCFFDCNRLVGTYGKLNGDDVYILTKRQEGMAPSFSNDCCCDTIACEGNLPDCARRCQVASSQIPRSIAEVTTTGDVYHVMECYRDAKTPEEIAKRLTESRNVKGIWAAGTYSIFGLVGNEVYELC